MDVWRVIDEEDLPLWRSMQHLQCSVATGLVTVNATSFQRRYTFRATDADSHSLQRDTSLASLTTAGRLAAGCPEIPAESLNTRPSGLRGSATSSSARRCCSG